MNDQYQMFDEDQIQIDFEDTDWDSEDGSPVRSRLTYTPLDEALTCAQVEEFAHGEAAAEGWVVESSGWTDDERTFVVETCSQVLVLGMM